MSWERIFTHPDKAQPAWLKALPGFAGFPFRAAIFSLHQDAQASPELSIKAN